MSQFKSKVKVDTARLLEAVKQRRETIVADHAKALEKYERDLGTYAELVEKAVEKIARNIERGKLPEYEDSYRHKGIVIPVGKSAPDKPNLDTSGIDRLIQTLDLAADDTITITADDARVYLG